MKICSQCGQIVAEEISNCPACGAEVAAGRAFIDDFRILEVLHEGYSSILCKARRDGDDAPVMIRIFTAHSGVDTRLADRLKHELEKLQALPEAYFVRHLAIRQSTDGLWYRISEWVDTVNWGTLLSTGRLKDALTIVRLFGQIASILDGLHRIGHIIPHLILDDILVYENDAGELKVKIDFKLSRFLDPQLDQPGPMLARLLALHPDIVNQRPLDHHSDIWSLGKAFVEVLCADPGVVNLHARVDDLPVPPEVQTLIRLMLSDDPELRPRSMADVAAALMQIEDRAIRDAARRYEEKTRGATRMLLRRVNVRLGLTAALLTLVIAVGMMLWYHLDATRQDSETALIGYANQYAGSAAFVVVDYWLMQGDRRVYHKRAEGTAFLADDRGHLLTNRHVACPWLEDSRLMVLIGLLSQRPEKLQFDYRMHLWFEGQRAFSRLPALAESNEVEDIYVTESAFGTQGPQRVWIAGVAPVPVNTRERVSAPLRDDFAVLKVDPVPPDLQPLPLAKGFSARTLPKLTPLITLGFPLGSRTQAETVNVSVTSGHVRRTFENMFQVDTSLHPGNSGGPFIDARGRVVGLATIVAVAWAGGPVPVATPLSDIGLILPITKAAAFLDEIRAGKTKWDGKIDVALEQRLQRITDTARRREWAKARDLADKELEASRAPPLVMTAAVMHLCAGDHDGGRRLFNRVLSIDADNNMARLMILVTDWLEGQKLTDACRQALTALDWRSADEFIGYLARILVGRVDPQMAIAGGYTLAEKSWLHLTAGLVEARRGRFDAAWPLLETAALNADTDDWSLFLALSQLDRIQHLRMARSTDPSVRGDYRIQLEALDRRIEQALTDKEKQRAEWEPIQSAIRQSGSDPAAYRSLLKKLRAAKPGNDDVLVAQAYYAAMDEDWEVALDYSRQFLARPGRTNAGKLSIGLLEPEILNMQGETTPARDRLKAYHDSIADPWYRALSSCLLDVEQLADVTAKAGENPENLLTAHTALGLWAEGSGDAAGAIRHYREALMSYRDNRIEYDFAMARVRRLRRMAE
jgi:tetratricopeptide (TPR) repeat protein